MGDRHVDVERLVGDAGALFGAHDAERAHVVHAVGELDDDDAKVAGHREEHLAEAFGLCRGSGGEAELVELAHAVDEFGDLDAEFFRHLLLARARVLKDVVHEARLNGRGVHAPGSENGGDGDRVGDVGFAGLSELSEMGGVGVAVGLADLFDVRRGEVLSAELDERRGGGGGRRRLGREERQVGLRHGGRRHGGHGSLDGRLDGGCLAR